MLQVRSLLKLDEVEWVLPRVAQRHGAHVHSIGRLKQAVVFTVSHPDLNAKLLAQDARFAVFLPSRIAACEQDGEVILEALSPRQYCGLLNRLDLENEAAPLESTLLAIMSDASRPVVEAAHAGARGIEHWAIGATDDQVNVMGTIPQRIDRKGTKVEDLAGTGNHDSSGG
ncbi:MAG: DUF302 domain-containing protein [Bryobacteraceae bacterium]